MKILRITARLILGCWLLAACLSGRASATTLTLEAGNVDRQPLIVEAPCTLKQLIGGKTESGPADGPISVWLLPKGNNKTAAPLLGQWTANGTAEPNAKTGTLVFRTRAPLPAGATRSYRVQPIPADKVPPNAIVVKNDPGNAVIVHRGDKPVLQYYTGIQRCPDRKQPNMDRTAYAHPLWSPAGKIVTDDFSPDHLHQRGLFIAWRQFKWGDHTSDFWSLAKGAGIIRHLAVENLRSGPVFAEFTARNLGVLPIDKGRTEANILREAWHMRIYDVGDDAFLYDVRIRHDAIEKDLILPKFKYGGFAYRGARAWKTSEPDILTSEGKGRDGDGHPARWCRFGGTLDGKPVSITIFDHAANPRYPKQLLRIHPTMPYYCFPINKSGPYVIHVGKPLFLRYRVYVTDGLPEPETLERLARNFVDPPAVRLAP